MFLHLSVILLTGGGGMRGCSRGAGEVCVVALGGHVWLLRGGGHAWLLWGGMCGCSGGACVVAQGACVVAPGGEVCVVALGGHAWLLQGGMHGCSGGHAWDTTRYGDTVSERAVRILLECILVVVS